jgi:hypothetical protein
MVGRSVVAADGVVVRVDRWSGSLVGAWSIHGRSIAEAGHAGKP